jgi:TPR repeat protein
MKKFFLLLCFFVLCNLSAAEDRVWLAVTINGQPARLAFDTGASFPVLFRGAAERLKLNLGKLPPGTPLAFDLATSPVTKASDLATNAVTEMCDFSWGLVSGHVQFLVLNLPSFEEGGLDGVLSWFAFRTNVIEFDPTKGMEISGTVPIRALSWPKFKQRTDLSILAFDVGGPDPQRQTVYVDTGVVEGVALDHTLWEKWVATHTQLPATMMEMETVQAGLVIAKEVWSEEISIGSLTLTHVPVRELNPKEELPDHAATLGMYALRRLDFVLDGKNGVVYARPRGDKPPLYAHNRLGAVFEPEDSMHDALIAHVAPRSPADLAGIRDGDVLVKIDGRDVTRWRTNSQAFFIRSWETPPDTTYRLTLKRADREFLATVTLKSILVPREQSLAEIRSKAEKGDAVAQTDLGRIYFFGQRGVPRDQREGVKWFRMAAEQDYPEAECNLGLLYENGDGVAKNGAEALKWYRNAAGQNYAEAQTGLGNCYANGVGLAKDPVEAVKWYRRAAEQNYGGAQYNLAAAYAQGVGVAKDDAEAFRWVRKAAEQNLAIAQCRLGYLYVNGIGVKKDAVEGVIWFHKAAQQNYVAALESLGDCYAYGVGAPKDLVEAYKWEALAAGQNSTYAKKRLAQLANQMTQAQVLEAQGLARAFKPVGVPDTQ